MIKLSLPQIVGVWIVTLNSFAINSIMILKDMNNKTKAISDPYQTQMEKLLKKSIVKVAIYRNKAYWVLNNVIYKAEIDEDGNILNEMAEEVDVFQLSEKEVNNLLAIIDSISN